MENKVVVANEQLSLKLPYDYPKTPKSEVNNRTIVNFNFGNGVFQHLSSHDTDENGIFLISGFISLLYRYTGQPVIPFRLSIHDRDDKQDLSLQVKTNGKLNFRQLEETIQNDITNNRNVPTSFNQIYITIKKLDDHTVLNGKSNTENLGNYFDVDQVELHLIILHNHNSVMVRMQYNKDLFSTKTVDRIGHHYENILHSAIKLENATLSGLNLFSEYEKKWHLHASTGDIRSYPAELLHCDIEKHAADNPDKIAVSDKLASLTYGELNQKANRLAHFLLQNGIKQNSNIIVCIEPCVDVAVALLSILKIGATYVPMNPGHPNYRITTIIEDIKPELIITHSSIREKLVFEGLSVLELDNQEVELSSYSKQNPVIVIDPATTAYVYYTSGTTGKPKGSIGTYSNLNHYIRVSQEKYGFSSSEIMPALASYTFSISMFELMSPLVAGGTLKVLERGDILDVESMVNILQQVTFVHAGPSLLKGIVKYIDRHIDDYSVFNNLRHLSSGGDMVPPDLLRKLQIIFRNTELYVIYGCSEIACMGCTYPIDPIRPIEKTYVGTPFDNVSVLVLDKDDNEVPIGVTGEVCIGGEGVATGYLNRPELTQERFFVRNNIRYYRTGDVGRFSREGNLELLGRTDFQIQIHGMRVELGEVEYHLRQAPGVRDGVVVARKHGAVDNTLVAFYVVNDKYKVSPESLRTYMSQYVPDYMVPTFYEQLDSLPLNINLKVDRKALLDVELSINSNNVGKVQNKPQTDTEKELANIWARLLKFNNIELQSNFLAIGGDSLLAMEMISIVHEKLGVKLEGMDVLRESLQVLSRICDSRLGIDSSSAELEPAISEKINPVESFFFGPDNTLYGLLSMDRKLETSHSVLICPPIGGAYKRCYYLLKVLADQLSSEGIPVMRFDYYGTNDSLGDDYQATISRWILDIRSAYDELRKRTNNSNIRVLGIQLGALLALKALGNQQLDQFLLWDPVTLGKSYFQNLLMMQKKRVWRTKTLRGFKRPKPIEYGAEFIGSTYSHRALRELQDLKLQKSDISDLIKVCYLNSLEYNNNNSTHDWDDMVKPDNNYNIEVDCQWKSPLALSKTIIDKRILSSLVRLLRENELND